jgi:hypothetical protein
MRALLRLGVEVEGVGHDAVASSDEAAAEIGGSSFEAGMRQCELGVSRMPKPYLWHHSRMVSVVTPRAAAAWGALRYFAVMVGPPLLRRCDRGKARIPLTVHRTVD